EYLKDLEECMDDGDSRVAKEMKLFDALEHKSIVIEVGNQKIAIFTKAPLRTFGEPFMRYSLPCKFDGKGAWNAELDLADSANYVTGKVLDSKGFVHVSISDYEVNSVIDLLEEVGSSSEEVVKTGKENNNKGENMKEVLDIRYKELKESKPILEVLENYVIYKKKLDEILIGKERLNKKDFSVEDKALQTNLTMVDNTQAKAMGKVKNVRIHIGYQAYVVDLLVLDIPVDPKLPLLLGRPFLRTSGAIIDMGTCNFKVGRDEDGNAKYGPVAPSFLDIEDDMERALAMETYFNLLKNIIVLKKLVDFLGSLPVQLKNIDWGNEGYAVLSLFTEDEVNHRLFGVHFGKLEADDRQFDHREYWTKVGKPTLTNHKEVLVREPLMRIVYKLIVGSLVHRLASRERDESSVICAGHYVTKIATYLEYYMDDEIKKCSEPIDCEYWKMKMSVEELDEKNLCLLKETGIPTQAGIGSSEQRQEPRGITICSNIPCPFSIIWRTKHYPNRGNQRNQGGGYGLGDDDYFTSAMTDFEGNTLRYAVGGSFRGAGFDDEDMDE
nr:hypothetical protein [Tanacetum cinerariifolium]